MQLNSTIRKLVGPICASLIIFIVMTSILIPLYETSRISICDGNFGYYPANSSDAQSHHIQQCTQKCLNTTSNMFIETRHVREIEYLYVYFATLILTPILVSIMAICVFYDFCKSANTLVEV